MQSCTGSVQGQNRVFPVKFSTQGKTCFHYRELLFSLQGPLFSLQGFPCEKTSQGKPCFHHREWVCSVIKLKASDFSQYSSITFRILYKEKACNDSVFRPEICRRFPYKVQQQILLSHRKVIGAIQF